MSLHCGQCLLRQRELNSLKKKKTVKGQRLWSDVMVSALRETEEKTNIIQRHAFRENFTRANLPFL